MKLEIKKIDDVNISLIGTISKKLFDIKTNNIAKEYAKNAKLDGFRKGKIPTSVIKQRFEKDLKKDVESSLLRDFLDKGIEELKIDSNHIIGDPSVIQFETLNDGNSNIEVSLEIRPTVKVDNYKDLIPKVKKITATKKEVDEKLNDIAKERSPFEDIKEDRGLQNDDNAIFDFEGFVDDKPFDGGKAEKFSLVIGSGRFIPGFEEGMVGTKKGEQRDINVKFPQDYNSKELAGKDAIFKIKLHNIQEKSVIKLDDELAKQILQDNKDATLKDLTNNIKTQIINNKKTDYYNKEIKPKFLDSLVEKFDFDLPGKLVNQEAINCANSKLQDIGEETKKELLSNQKAIEELRNEHLDEAKKNVKITFLIDQIAKDEKIDVTEKEIMSAIYYEGYMSGQDPKALLDNYKSKGLLPMVKMAMIEDKLCIKLFDEKSKETKPKDEVKK
jgi:trigger factor